MNISRQFCQRLGIAHPIIQGPMAGDATTPALVAAVSNAGGLGSIGAAYLTPAQITSAIADVRRLTDKPFNVNIFTGGYEPLPGDDAIDPSAMLRVLARHHAALGLPPPALPEPQVDPSPGQIEAILEARVPIFSFTLGIPSAAVMKRFKQQGALIMGTATTVAEAKLLADAGVDAIVAQGGEAGGHRGTFAGPYERALIGTMALTPQVVDAVPDIPVIAAGGIMDGRGAVAACALGAVAAQFGTAFLACDEAGVPEAHKNALSGAAADSTVVTRAFSGRAARAISNAFVRDVEMEGSTSILPFSVQNTLTRAMRTVAGKAGDSERLSLWAGQGVGLARRMKAAELVARLVEEMTAAFAGLRSA